MKIAIVGQQCSGKTELARMLQEIHGGISVIVKFADPIYATVARLHKSKHRAFMQEFSDLAKKHFGEQVFAEIFKARVSGIDLPLMICDDVRRDYEAQAAIDCGFDIVYLHADRGVRKVRAWTWGLDFIEDHISETQVPELERFARFRFENSGFDIGELGDIARTILAAARPK